MVSIANQPVILHVVALPTNNNHNNNNNNVWSNNTLPSNMNNNMINTRPNTSCNVNLSNQNSLNPPQWIPSTNSNHNPIFIISTVTDNGQNVNLQSLVLILSHLVFSFFLDTSTANVYTYVCNLLYT